MKPAPSPGRLAALDALRGAAMLGIVLVNFPSMNTAAGNETTAYGGVGSTLDRWVAAANLLLLNGKFYPIFAALFGLGLFLADRSRGGARPAPDLARRRLVVLLAIGVLHVALVWWGDILVVYALLGLLALPCRRWPARRLLVAALVLLLAPQALSLLLGALARLGVPLAGRAVLPGLDLALPSPEAAAATYQAGAFGALVRQRALDWLADFTPFTGRAVTAGALAGYAAYYAQLFGLFLIGLWAGQRGLHVRLLAGGAEPRRWLAVAAPAAVLLTALGLAVPSLSSPLSPWQGTALALVYVLALAIALPRFPRARGALEAAGRTSLTVYLGHTTTCSLLLHADGLGLYGRVGPALLLPLSLATWAALAAGAVLWSRRFRLGPAEWAWRSLVQGRALPLRRAGAASALLE